MSNKHSLAVLEGIYAIARLLLYTYLGSVQFNHVACRKMGSIKIQHVYDDIAIGRRLAQFVYNQLHLLHKVIWSKSKS